MRLAELSEKEIAAALRANGLVLCIKPFVVRIRSSIPDIATGLYRLYAEFDIKIDGDNDFFVDFDVSVKSVRQGYKRLAVFTLDGREPFTPLSYNEAYAVLEWGLNWCVTAHCHHWLTIHAAVLEKNNRAVVMPAPPGSGKSTLCAALMLHGWRLLSDEMTLLEPGTGLVTPVPRAVSLKNKSIDVIRSRYPGVVMGPIAHDTLKGTVCHLKITPASVDRADQSVLPAWVVFPRYEAGSILNISPLTKAETLLELAKNSFNQHVHGEAGFDLLCRVMDNSEGYHLKYSELTDALNWFDGLVVDS